MIVNRDKAGQPRGISFEQVSHTEQGEEIRTAFKGSKLHQNLSLGGLQQQLEQNARLRQQQALEAAKEKQREQANKLAKTPQIEDKPPKKGLSRGM